MERLHIPLQKQGLCDQGVQGARWIRSHVVRRLLHPFGYRLSVRRQDTRLERYMNDKYLADLVSQNIGKNAYIKYHRSELSDYSSVEGVIESFNAEPKAVVLSSKSEVVHFGTRPYMLSRSVFLRPRRRPDGK